MNFQDFDVGVGVAQDDYRQTSPAHTRPYSPRSPRTSSDSFTRRQLGTRALRSNSISQSQISPILSLSPQPSATPQIPSSPSPPSYTASESYGPDRVLAFTPPARAYYGVGHLPLPRPPPPAPLVHFDEGHLAMLAADNSARMNSIKDDLALAAGKVTPGVDDTPYIQYALHALTRIPGEPSEAYFPSGTSGASSQQQRNYQPPRTVNDHEPIGIPSVIPTSQAVLPSSQRSLQTPGDIAQPPSTWARGMAELEQRHQQQQHQNKHQQQPAIMNWDPTPAPTTDRWEPVTKAMRAQMDPHNRTHPPLTFKPRVLRPLSMMTFMTLCILMTAALIFTARYGHQHSGLTPYPGSIYSGQYFLFRILPQLLGAVILIYAQSLVATSLRVLPFVAMASEDPKTRSLALFQSLYPKSFLRPQLVGPWQFMAFDIATWLSAFTIPLQSSAFACIYPNRTWTWAPVQAVVWTLIALYLILFVSAAILMVFWSRQWTGLLWDIRSIADMVPLLNRSNTMNSYGKNGFFQQTDDFKEYLRNRWTDRLGYWQMENSTTGGMWYAIGAVQNTDTTAGDSDNDRRYSSERFVDSPGLTPPNDFGRLRHGYLPWYLRNIPVIASVMIASGLLLALLIVSFLPKTALNSGYSPLLLSRPNSAAFSPSNFLYSFLPSFLGMVLFLLFQSVDQSIRILQPWADLSRVNGAVARKSVLADYASCLPFQSAWRAMQNGHWRVAALSLMGVLFVFIPVLAGGLFMALAVPDGKIRMYASMPVFGVLLAFLFLYVGSLSLLLPRRGQFLLAHPVTSIAGIISFCSAEDLTQDAAFRSVRSKRDLEGRLGVGRDPREESVWFFGIVPGKDEQRLSVRRMKRFTEKRMIYEQSMV